MRDSSVRDAGQTRHRALIEAILWTVFAAVWLRLTIAPLPPIHLSWQLLEDLKHGNVPSYERIAAENCSRSEEGLIIGDGMDGFIEWRFMEADPHPSVVVIDWLPSSSRSRVVLVMPSQHGVKSTTLSQNESLRNRSFDLTHHWRHTKALGLRFEGKGAALSRLQFYQSIDPFPPLWPFAVLLMSLLLLYRARPDRYFSIFVIGVAFAFRWHTFRDFFSVPLSPDPTGFWMLGQGFHLSAPFHTGLREPLFPWLTRLASVLFGNSERSLRLLSVLFSLGIVVALPAVARRVRLPSWAGLSAAILYAVNPFAIFMSAQGYQLEAFSLLILLWTIVFLDNKPYCLGFLSALLCWIRIQSLFAVFPGLIWVAWRQRWSSRTIGGVFALVLMLLVPYFRGAIAETGRWLGHLDEHAAFYTAAERWGDPDQKSRVASTSFRQFLFREHSVATLIGKTVAGYFNVFANPVDPFNRILLNSHYSRQTNIWLFPFFWIGLIVLMTRRNGRGLLLSGLLFLSALPFLKDTIREPRLLFHIAPLVALVCAAGIYEALTALRRYFSTPSTQSTS